MVTGRGGSSAGTRDGQPFVHPLRHVVCRAGLRVVVDLAHDPRRVADPARHRSRVVERGPPSLPRRADRIGDRAGVIGARPRTTAPYHEPARGGARPARHATEARAVRRRRARAAARAAFTARRCSIRRRCGRSSPPRSRRSAPRDLAKVHAVRFNVPQIGGLVQGPGNASRTASGCTSSARSCLLTIGLVDDRRPESEREVDREVADRHHRRASRCAVVHPGRGRPERHDRSVGASVRRRFARALGAGIVTGLVVLTLVGVVFLFVDLFIPGRANDELATERVEATRPT